MIGYGLIFNMWLCVLGGAMVLAGFVGWVLEPADDPDLPPHVDEPHGPDGDDHDSEAAAEAAPEADGDAAPDAPATEEEVSVGD